MTEHYSKQTVSVGGRAWKEARIKYESGTPLDERIERLTEFYGIDRAALVQLALRRLEATTFPNEMRVTTPFRPVAEVARR
jgi:hypothetical protein